MQLCGRGLTAADIESVALAGAEVQIAPDAAALIAERHASLAGAVAEGMPIYGVTTGLGPGVTKRLEPSPDLPLRTLRGRAVGVGEPLPSELVRAAMTARLNGLCLGGSGISLEPAEVLCAMLNAGVHPIVPRYGSVGASDLCLMAHIGLVVAGEGEAEYQGSTLPGAVALERAGLTPANLALKDGLALCSASSVGAGAGALAVRRGRRLLARAQTSAALSMEGFRSSLTPIDPRVVAARPAPGQEWAAAGLRAILSGGDLTRPGAARRVQDPLSFRCVSQVHGSLHVALNLLEAAVEPELNAAADNPLVLDGGEVISNGNFHTPAIALAADTVAIGIAQVAAPLVERLGRLLTETISGLPSNLTRQPTGSAGLAALQKPAQALATDIRQRATPFALDPRPSAESIEDDATNSTPAVLRLDDQLDLLTQLIAIECVIAAQAVDLAAPGRLGAGTAEVHGLVRSVVEPLDQDRPLSGDVAAVARLLG